MQENDIEGGREKNDQVVAHLNTNTVFNRVLLVN